MNETETGTVNVVDDLDTQSSTDALSANMGYELNQRLTTVETAIANKATDADIDALFAATAE